MVMVMFATVSTSASLPVPSPHYPAKFTRRGYCYANSGSMKSKSTSGALQFKANAQPPAKINGSSSSVGLTTFPKAAKVDSDCTMNDQFGLGRLIVQDGLVFRQNFTIRSYEIGADRMASIETLMNKLQETALNLSKTTGLNRDSFGATWEMNKRSLIWVLAKRQVLVDRYPTWGDVLQVDTRLSGYGKNGMRMNSLLRDSKTREILTRASSVFVMINKHTRKLSKMPEEVREELEPYLLNSAPVMEEDSRKLAKLDGSTADYVVSGLTPRWSDLDLNQHVNNVKYTSWILMSVPQSIFETHGLSAITVDYKRECGKDNSDLQSLTKMISGDGTKKSHKVDFQHLLQFETGPEIVRARTEWRPKKCNNERVLDDF